MRVYQIFVYIRGLSRDDKDFFPTRHLFSSFEKAEQCAKWMNLASYRIVEVEVE